jgi:hypothetical protein
MKSSNERILQAEKQGTAGRLPLRSESNQQSRILSPLSRLAKPAQVLAMLVGGLATLARCSSREEQQARQLRLTQPRTQPDRAQEQVHMAPRAKLSGCETAPGDLERFAPPATAQANKQYSPRFRSPLDGTPFVTLRRGLCFARAALWTSPFWIRAWCSTEEGYMLGWLPHADYRRPVGRPGSSVQACQLSAVSSRLYFPRDGRTGDPDHVLRGCRSPIGTLDPATLRGGSRAPFCGPLGLAQRAAAPAGDRASIAAQGEEGNPGDEAAVQAFAPSDRAGGPASSQGR